MLHDTWYMVHDIKALFIAILLAGLLLPSGHLLKATDFTSTNFIVKDPVIEPGAGFSTSTNFRLWSSIGQDAIGLSATTSFGLRGGFLYFPAVAAPPPSPPPPPPTGGAGFVLPLPPVPEIPILLIPPVPPPPPEIIKMLLICDFNFDELCNIIDFSIILFYYGILTILSVEFSKIYLTII